MVELVVQGVSVQAVVDAGAKVSVLSKWVYDQLDPKPPIKQYVTMTQAGENAKMNSFIVGPVEMQLGSTGYRGDLYVAPLQDQMLLGMEFLHRRKARLDLENGVITLDRGTVPMMFGRAEGPLGAQVITAQPLRIPAASADLCLCHLDRTLGNFAVSPDPMG
jgi:predicted aspartyl protease